PFPPPRSSVAAAPVPSSGAAASSSGSPPGSRCGSDEKTCRAYVTAALARLEGGAYAPPGGGSPAPTPREPPPRAGRLTWTPHVPPRPFPGPGRALRRPCGQPGRSRDRQPFEGDREGVVAG